MKLTQKTFEAQERILVGEHPSDTRVGGWHGDALFEWNEFAQPSIFVSFFAMKKENPRAGT